MKNDLMRGTLAAALAVALGSPLLAQEPFSIPPDSIALSDLATAFTGSVAGWHIAGDASADRNRDLQISSTGGTGVLVNDSRPGRGDNLRTAWEHGDIDLELEFMMPRGGNSGIYFQGRYELQLLDSWKVERPTFADLGGVQQRWDESRGAGREGFEGHAPRLNAARAPGLWQTLRVEFRAPRFAPDGTRISPARFARVELNGVVLHENLELSGPTRAAHLPGEAATGPLILQGDLGPVAFRRIRYKRYGPDPLALNDLRYRVYEGSFVRLPDMGEELPTRFGPASGLSAAAAGVADGFALVHEGTIQIPTAGRYLLELGLNWMDASGGDGTQGGARLTVGGREVLLHDGRDRVVRAQADLPAGEHPIVLELFKNRQGRPSTFTLFAEGPGVARQALHTAAALRPGTAAGPIQMAVANEPTLLRGFVEHGGTKRTHTIAVGDPTGIHYVYDPQLGAPLVGWRGPFLETTQMWDNRGEPQLAEPLGSPMELPGGPSFAFLQDASQAWPDSLLPGDDHRILGYDLDASRHPVFRYQRGPVTVQDWIRPTGDLSGLIREIEFAAPQDVGGGYLRLASGEEIVRNRDGSYTVDGRYYLVPARGLRGIAIRQTADGQELIVPVAFRRGTARVEYQIVW